MIQRQSILKTLFIMAVLLLGVTAAGAQTQKVQLPGATLTVGKALTEIKEQAGIGVIFNSRLFDTGRVVDFGQRETTVEAILKAVTAGTGFRYVINGNMVSISKEEVKVLSPPVQLPRTPDGFRRSNPEDFDTPPGRRPQRPARAPLLDTVYNVVQAERQVEDPGGHQSLTAMGGRFAINQGRLPRFALKTNLPYWATGTPNFAFEFGSGPHTSVEMSGSYNPWNRKGTLKSNKKLVHMILKPEFRYWTCERFNGHFFGIHAIYSRYNIGSHDIPLLFDKEYRYEGWAAGGGIAYGYNLPLSRQWGVEFGIGAGVLHLDYDRYDCAACSIDDKPGKKTYFGPTDASISLIFLIK